MAVPASYVLGINLSLRVADRHRRHRVDRPRRVAGRAMVETHFEPVPAAARSTWRAMGSRRRPGVRAIRASHALTFLAVAIFLAGGASEAYDRYVEKYLLGLGTPGWPGGRTLTWLAVVGCLSAALGIVVPWWFERRHGHLDADAAATLDRRADRRPGRRPAGARADRLVRRRRGDEPRASPASGRCARACWARGSCR